MALSFREEQQLYGELSQWESRRAMFQAQSSRELAETVSRLAAGSPYAPPEVIMPAARAVRDGRMTEEAALGMLDSATRVEIDNALEDQQNVDNRSTLRRIIDAGEGALKTGVKWGVATLEFVPQVINNAAARVYMSGDRPAGEQQSWEEADPNSFISKPTTDAFDLGAMFQSTDLGALFGGESGSGYFIGEAAKERQLEAVKSYRGTIGGEAFTLGKGTALIFSQPGSRAFNIASGLVDAATAIALPAVPGGKAISRAAQIEAGKKGARTLAGLTNFAEPYIQPQRFQEWSRTAGARRIFEEMADANTISKAKELFPKADYKWWNDVAEIGARADLDRNGKVQQLRVLLADPERGLGIGQGLTDVRNVKIGAGSSYAREMRNSKILRTERARLAAPRAGNELVLSIDDPNDLRGATQTIVNTEAYLRTARVAQPTIDNILGRMSQGFATGDRAVIDEMIEATRNELINQIANSPSVGRRASPDFVKAMFQRYDEKMKEFREMSTYGDVTGAGAAKVHEGLVAKLDGFEDLVADVSAAGIAQTATEVAKFSTFLPDIRKIRRATSKYGWLFSPTAKEAAALGDPRALVSALDFVTNTLFRPSVLFTGGYRLRNMIESAFFRAPVLRGIDAGPTHPFEWGMVLSGKKFIGDLDGNTLDEVGQSFAGKAGRDWREATGAKPREVMSDAGQLEMAYRGGYYALARKELNSENYVRGLAGEIRLLTGDPIARRLVDETVDEVVEYLQSPEGRRALELLESRHKNVMLEYVDGSGTRVKKRGDIVYRTTDANGNEVFTESLYRYVQDLSERVERVTAGNYTLKDIIRDADGNGRFLTYDGNQGTAFLRSARNANTAADEYEVFDYSQEFLDEIRHIWDVENQARAAGQVLDVELPEFVKFVKPIDLQDLGINTRGGFWRNTMNYFFSEVFGKPEAWLNRSPVFKQFYYKKVRELIDANLVSQEGYDFAYRNIVRSARQTVDARYKMIRNMTPDADGMYRWNEKPMSPSAYRRLLRSAEKDVQQADRWVTVRTQVDEVTGREFEVYEVTDDFDIYGARYVGSDELWQIIKERRLDSTLPMDGLSGDRLSFVAKAFAMEQTKQGFYNAAETSNFTDILRIMVPFGAAWNESMRFYVKEILTQPQRAKNVAVTVQGFRDMDPDDDGKGFIFQDPVTGEMVFNYPLDAKLFPALGAFFGSTLTQTFARGGARSALLGAAAGGLGAFAVQQQAASNLQGLDATMQAPAQSLSQAFQVLPGFGPVVQFSAAQLLGDKPQYDDVMSIVAPFGSYNSLAAAVLPSWAQKVTQAISADPDNDRLFGDLYIDATRALYATGQYDNTDPESMQVLRQHARRAAQTLLVMRGIGQFTGPTRPELELRVPTKFEGEITVNDIKQMVDGNITSSLLAAAFRQMQEDDYENAVQNFLRTFGADMMMYLPGLTNTEVKGLQATDLFGDWERNNRDITEKFPLVYGYFAPVGGEFELQTYLRQIREKKRRKITDPQELQRDAEAVVGRALYADAVRMAGLDPSEGAQRQLKEYREELEKMLPGFATAPLNIRERDQIMMQIESASRDVELDGNPVAEAARVYFDYRQQAIDEATRRNDGLFTDGLLGRKANADLRQWMRNVGDALTNQYPEFQRLYGRVLFDEVDL